MSLLWSINRARDLAERRKHQQKCQRCGLFYSITDSNCPHCTDLSDYKIKWLLKKRSTERTSLGRYMLYAMLAILIAMLVSNV